MPSLTEALFALGVGEKVVGRTRYCTQPPRAVGRVAKVGGTKKVDVERVLSLEPDLMVAVMEENSREDVEAIGKAGVPVLVGEPATVEEAIQFLKKLADRVDAPEKRTMVEPIERVYERLKDKSVWKRRVFVPIWKGPYMSVGRDTYMHDVLETCGGENVCGEYTRYPIVSPEEIEAAQPEVILLPDEPYPFSAEDLAAFRGMDIPAVRHDRLYLVDGKLLSWYGPRMAGSLSQLAALLRF